MFIVFESVINFAMIIEVGVRLLALRRVKYTRNAQWQQCMALFILVGLNNRSFRLIGTRCGILLIPFSLRSALSRWSWLLLVVQLVNEARLSLILCCLLFVIASNSSAYSWLYESKSSMMNDRHHKLTMALETSIQWPLDQPGLILTMSENHQWNSVHWKEDWMKVS